MVWMRGLQTARRQPLCHRRRGCRRRLRFASLCRGKYHGQHPLESHQRRRRPARSRDNLFRFTICISPLQKTSPSDILNLTILNDCTLERRTAHPRPTGRHRRAADSTWSSTWPCRPPTTPSLTKPTWCARSAWTTSTFPLSGNRPSLKIWLQFMDAMDAHHARKIFVHCAMNYRASAFIALWRTLRQGWAREQAFAAQNENLAAGRVSGLASVCFRIV
jgi:hypothetical protein